MATRSRFHDLSKFVTEREPVIVDIGAHICDTVVQLLGVFPGAKTHAIEARHEQSLFMKERFSNKYNISIYNKAIGAINSNVKFNILEHGTSSSVLKPSKLNMKYHGSEMGLVREVVVEQDRLDDLMGS